MAGLVNAVSWPPFIHITTYSFKEETGKMVKEDYDDRARLATFISFAIVGVIGWFVLPRAKVTKRC